MPRKRILNTAEARAFDAPPSLSDEERAMYFDDIAFSPRFLEISRSMSKANKVYYLAVLVYFTLRKRFFKDFNRRDLFFFCRKFGIGLHQLSSYLSGCLCWNYYIRTCSGFREFIEIGHYIQHTIDFCGMHSLHINCK